MLEAASAIDTSPLLPSPADARRNAEAEEQGRQALRERSDRWETEHGERAQQLVADFLRDTPNAGADERVLLRLAAGETELAKQLEQLMAQLLGRASLLVDTPSHVVTLTKTLKEVAAVSGAIGRRIESLLTTARSLQLQRQLAGEHRIKPSHLRVA